MKPKLPYAVLLGVLVYLVWAFANRAEAALPAWFLDAPISTLWRPDLVTFTPGFTIYCWLRPHIYGWAAYKIPSDQPFDTYLDNWLPSDGKFCKAAATAKWPKG